MIHSYRYNSTICDLLINTILKNRQRFQSDGYAPLKGSKIAIDKTVKNNKGEKPQELDALKIDYLERIAKEKRDNCLLLFVISPTYEVIDKRDYNIVRDICKRYNISLLEYENDRRFVGKAKLYYDGAHLNDDGARYYTEILASDVKRFLSDTRGTGQ